MNNLKFILIFLLLIISSVVNAGVNINEVMQVVSKNLYFRDKSVERDIQIIEIDKTLKSLEAAINAEPNNPINWYLKGLAGWSKVVILGETLSTQTLQDMKQPVFESYRKALELDKTHEPHLTRDMLNSLMTFGSSDVYVVVAQRILDEKGYMNTYGELEIRGGMAVHFTELGRYDEALQVFDEFEKNHPGEYTGDVEFKRNYHTKKIQAAKLAAQVQTNVSPDGAVEKIPATITEPATENQNPNPETNTTDTTNLIKFQPHWLWYVLILAAVIGIAGVMFARRKK